MCQKFQYFLMQDHQRIEQLSQRLNAIQGNVKTEISFMHDQADTIVQQVREQYNVNQKASDRRLESIGSFAAQLERACAEQQRMQETQLQVQQAKFENLQHSVAELINQVIVRQENNERILHQKLDTQVKNFEVQLTEELAHSEQCLDLLQIHLDDQLPQISEQLQKNHQQREFLEQQLKLKTQTSFDRLQQLLRQEAQEQANQNERIKMDIKHLLYSARQDIDDERREREHSEEQMIVLLEQTCRKFEKQDQSI